eukprot:124990_1
MSKEVIHIICGGTSCVVSIAIGVFVLYYTLEFYKLKNDMVFIKRRGNVVTIYSFCAVWFLIIGNPSYLYKCWFSELHLDRYSVPYDILNVISDVLYNPPTYFILFMCFMRYWMMYYDIQFSNGCLNLKWKEHIRCDQPLTASEKWYIEHRPTYGNLSFLFKRVVICTCIISPASLTFVFMFEFGVTDMSYELFLNLIVFSTVIGTLVYLSVYKIPNFQDNIYLSQEAKAVAYTWIITWLIYATNQLITVFVGVHLINRLLIDLSSTVAIASCPFVSTYWVLKRITESELANAINTNLTESQSHSHGDDYRNRDGSVGMQIVDILQDKRLIDLFVQQMIKEFSVECVLSLIEFQQFKAFAMDKLKINRADYATNEKSNALITFPDGVPLSDIVYGEETESEPMATLKIKAHKLYLKYIADASEFEINISWRRRAHLHHLMGDYDQWMAQDIEAIELVSLFDAAEWSMLVMLIDARKRFRMGSI